MKLSNKIQVLIKLGEYILEKSEALQHAVHHANAANAWFTEENIYQALNAIATSYLNDKRLTSWSDQYNILNQKKRIGLVLAGNIPLVGFHDILCVFISGNISVIKLSEKDSKLIPFLINILIEINPDCADYFEIVDRITIIDAVIATGSNNSAHYFEQYFGKYPHIIRKNRNGIAILSGDETDQELLNLGADVFNYFGLGCRNVSKVYLPIGYNTDILMKAFEVFGPLNEHNKYRNNYDYTLALWLLNQVIFKQNNCFLLREHTLIPSRIATLHFEYYENVEDLSDGLLHHHMDEIQCIISNQTVKGFKNFKFGEAQKPSLQDYPDGVDTLAFLTTLDL